MSRSTCKHRGIKLNFSLFDNASVGSCRRFGSPGASELPTKGHRRPFQRRHELECELGKTMTRIVGRETQRLSFVGMLVNLPKHSAYHACHSFWVPSL